MEGHACRNSLLLPCLAAVAAKLVCQAGKGHLQVSGHTAWKHGMLVLDVLMNSKCARPLQHCNMEPASAIVCSREKGKLLGVVQQNFDQQWLAAPQMA